MEPGDLRYLARLQGGIEAEEALRAVRVAHSADVRAYARDLEAAVRAAVADDEALDTSDTIRAKLSALAARRGEQLA